MLVLSFDAILIVNLSEHLFFTGNHFLLNLSGHFFDFRLTLFDIKAFIVWINILRLWHQILRLKVLSASEFVNQVDIEVWLRVRLILWVRKWLLLKLLSFLVLLDSILNLVPTFLDLLSEFLFDGRDCWIDQTGLFFGFDVLESWFKFFEELQLALFQLNRWCGQCAEKVFCGFQVNLVVKVVVLRTFDLVYTEFCQHLAHGKSFISSVNHG